MYLLDTDIIIYALKGRPGVVSQLEKLMELYSGAHRSQQAEANLARVRTLEH